jgi:hypothetical protein
VTGAPAVRCRRCRAVLGYDSGRELCIVTGEGKRLAIKGEVRCECGLWRRWSAPAKKSESASERVL